MISPEQQAEWTKLLRSIGATRPNWKLLNPKQQSLHKRQQDGSILTSGDIQQLVETWQDKEPYLDADNKPFVLYIADRIEDFQYKYHFMHCKTQKGMKLKNRDKRYRAKYDLEEPNFPNAAEPPHYERLKVCINCLDEFFERTHFSSLGYEEIPTVETFAVIEFFAALKGKYPHLEIPPAYADNYPSDWAEISRRYKAAQGWKCEECGKDCSARKGCLHTHHINGVKGYCRPHNLQALCCECHRKQPYHGHLSCSCRKKPGARRQRQAWATGY